MRESHLPVGKLPQSLLGELLGDGPPLPAEVAVGPRIGEDACVIEVEQGVLVAATDPITMTGSAVGGHAVIINANDVAVTGVRPRYFLATLLFPEGSTEHDVRALFADMRGALARVGAALVGGHTEVTPAVGQTVVVGQMLGTAPAGDFVATGSSRPGEVLIQVGPAPVEGAVVLASSGDPRIAALDPDRVERALAATEEPGISIVDAALHSMELGAKALHDPTEGGLSAGLYELAQAGGVRLRLREEHVLWFEPGCDLCRAVGADPWGTLASGSLLAVFAPDRAHEALAALARVGRPASLIGNVERGSGVCLASGEPLARYERDELSRVL